MELGEYLFRRLKEVGVGTVHGVPGDFNLTCLDYVEKTGLNWVGNCNELNAGFAADGYARVNGISALMTVMGVGELTAISAMAGAFAEYVPIVHIVGQPSRRAQDDQLCLHHTLGDGNYSVFEDMCKAVACHVVKLNDPESASRLIDDAIRECIIQSRPAFILFPTDMVNTIASCNTIENILDTSFQNKIEDEVSFAECAIQELNNAHSPVCLIGGYGVGEDIAGYMRELVHLLKIPAFIVPTGKGILDDTTPYFRGLYVGECSDPSTTYLVETADLIVSIGCIHSDLNTAGFTGKADSKLMIDLQRNRSSIRGSPYARVHLKGLLKRLIDTWTTAGIQNGAHCIDDNCIASSDNPKTQLIDSDSTRSSVPSKHRLLCMSVTSMFRNISGARRRFRRKIPVRHDLLWPAVEAWITAGDVVLTETGTPSFGIWKTKFPKDVLLVSQYVWASIGYTVGACQGAAQAVRDSSSPKRRTILFIGDGSFQFGCQELSTMFRMGLRPIIFVICNNGYTTERLINGWRAEYNDIQPWQFTKLPGVFGASPGEYRTHCINTMDQLESLLQQESFNNGSALQLVELNMGQDDAPSDLLQLAQSLKRRNQSS